MNKNITIGFLIVAVVVLVIILFTIKPKNAGVVPLETGENAMLPSTPSDTPSSQTPKPTATPSPQSPVASNPPATPPQSGPHYQQGDVVIPKNDWGISFGQPLNWNMTNNTGVYVALQETSGPETGDIMTLQYSSGANVTDTDAKFGNVTFFYDNVTQKWMKSGLDEVTNAPVTVVVTPTYTATGLPVFMGTGRWKTYIIALSHTTFLKLNITGSGYSQSLTNLLATIQKI